MKLHNANAFNKINNIIEDVEKMYCAFVTLNIYVEVEQQIDKLNKRRRKILVIVNKCNLVGTHTLKITIYDRHSCTLSSVCVVCLNIGHRISAVNLRW